MDKDNKMSHNDIVLELNNEKLTLLLCDQFGKISCWSSFSWVVNNKIEEWTQQNTTHLLKTLEKETFDNLKDIKDKFTESKMFISFLPKEKSLQIEKTFEFPLVKGDGQYKCTKGFIDLIVHCIPVQSNKFSTCATNNPIEFIIEIKKEKDFDDFGNILRQIKEYREYYNGYGVKRWTSKIIPINEGYRYGRTDNKEWFFCVLSTKIPDNIKSLFQDEGILCLELNNII